MAVLEASVFRQGESAMVVPASGEEGASLNPLAGTGQLLREVPRLLEYRAEADPDAEFIPKTIAGFAGGFLVMSASLAVGWVMLKGTGPDERMNIMATLMAFMIGIAGVASSLLLVGLKVRADHTAETLFARHWLNSLTTGAIFSALVCGPWMLHEEGFVVNRFVAAALWMGLMAFPAVAAKWTVQRHPSHEVGE